MGAKEKLELMTFGPEDLVIILGIGAVLGGLMGMAGIVIGALCAVSGWALTKVKKKEKGEEEKP